MNETTQKVVLVIPDLCSFANLKDGLKLAAVGKKLAIQMGACLTAFLCGNNAEGFAGHFSKAGADRILIAEAPCLAYYVPDVYSKIICRIVTELKPDTVLFPADSFGLELAPILASSCRTGLVAESMDMECDADNETIKFTTAAVGNLLATIVCSSSRPQIATVKTEDVDLTACPEHIGYSSPIRVDVDDIEPARTSHLKTWFEENNNRGLDNAGVVIVAGLGIGSKDGFEKAAQLAAKIGGSIAASRAAVEAGWADESIMVGQTGKTISPDLCIEIGVSGAIQHAAGIKRAKTIVAVNKDAAAPVFKYADYGVVGDAMEFIIEFEAALEGCRDVEIY